MVSRAVLLASLLSMRARPVALTRSIVALLQVAWGLWSRSCVPSMLCVGWSLALGAKRLQTLLLSSMLWLMLAPCGTTGRCEHATRLRPMGRSCGCCAGAGAWLLSGRMRDYFLHGWSMLDAVLRPLLGAARPPLMKLPGLAARHAVACVVHSNRCTAAAGG